MAQVGGKDVNNNELGIMGAAVAIFIFSFLPWFSIAGYHGNAWDVGFLAYFPVILVIQLGLLVAARNFLPTAVGPSRSYLPVLAGATLATLLLLLKLIVGYHSTSRSAGLFLGIVAAAVQLFFAFTAVKLSGEPLPGGRRL